MSFQLPDLSYDHNALEPYIDSKTMQIHHGKHHAGYTSKLNAAIAGTDLEGKSIEDILKNLDMNNSGVRNNGGGYYNHCLFWEIMGPTFGSFDEFKSKFSTAAGTRFGSGWAWLCADSKGGLEVCSTANQDNPLMPGECGKTPIIGLDVWEHAYYLNYQNRRPDYIEAFFSVVNWDVVAAKFNKA